MNTKKFQKRVKRTSKQLRNTLRRAGPLVGTAAGVIAVGGYALTNRSAIRSRSEEIARLARDWLSHLKRPATEEARNGVTNPA